ncbi:hypothetical protein [Williamsoniiplasma luminosum]|uniref:hypothetical protein n=1 Tax=Williamsoniiplasma luminosum TaxID=214888 RepID=UPI0026F055B1|nr:hypothetical protein [Williamsoniiplasma luminosum]
MLIIMIKKSALIGVVGTFVFVLFAITPFVGAISSSNNLMRIPNDFASQNYSLQIAKKVNDLSEKYGENSYINRMINDMKIFKENKFTYYKDGETTPWNIDINDTYWKIAIFSTPEYKKQSSSYLRNPVYASLEDFDKNYLYDLMLTGLGSEVEKLPVFITKQKDVYPQIEYQKIYVNLSPGVKETTTWKWMERINEIGAFKTSEEKEKAYSPNQITKSLFYNDGSAYKEIANKYMRFSGEFEYFETLEKLLKQADEQETKLLNLTKEIIKGNYLLLNGGAFENFAMRESWNKFNFLKDERWNNDVKTDWTWSKFLGIAPGVRTIQKIMFNLIEKTAYVEKENGSDPFLKEDTVFKQIKAQFWNPLNVFWKQFINISNDEISDLPLDTQPFSPEPSKAVTTVYKAVGLDSLSNHKMGFDKFTGQNNGRNYESIKAIGDTINLPLSYVMMILIVLIFIALSYFIFYKKIIK